MERNRKILIAILAVLVLSTVIAIIDVSITMRKTQSTDAMKIKPPQVGPGVAVIRLEGPIQFMGRQGTFSMVSGVEAVLEQLEKAMENPNIRAVVIRINSPGGSVAATQEIYQKVWKLRKKNIPIVASVSEVAASGGYYVASACNEIMANHGSITGSIGVIAMSANLQELFKKLGISMTIIKSGKYKDVLSSHRELYPEEREFLQEMIDSSYQKFLKDIALGRNMNISEIKPYADGRVFTGKTAKEYGLIDNLGTFDDALSRARELGKLPENSPVYEKQRRPWQQILTSLDGMIRNWIHDLRYGSEIKLEYR